MVNTDPRCNCRVFFQRGVRGTNRLADLRIECLKGLGLAPHGLLNGEPPSPGCRDGFFISDTFGTSVEKLVPERFGGELGRSAS